MEDVEIVEKLTNHEENIKSLKHRMSNIKEQSQAINSLALSVKELAINMKIMNEKQEEQGKRLTELESKPGKRWEQVVSIIIPRLVGELVGYSLSKVGL